MVGITGGTIRPIEPVPIMPVFSHGMAWCDLRGGNFEFALYTDQCGALGNIERILTHRQIMPLDGVCAALPLVLRQVPRAAAFEIAKSMRGLLTAGH